MTLAIPSAATFAIARQVSLAEAWRGLVRYVRSKPLRWAALIAIFMAGAITLGILAATAPVVGTLAAVYMLLIVTAERWWIGMFAALKRTLACERWAAAQQRAQVRALIQQALRALLQVLTILAALAREVVSNGVAQSDATTRLRRGALVLTVLPQLHSRSLSLARG